MIYYIRISILSMKTPKKQPQKSHEIYAGMQSEMERVNLQEVRELFQEIGYHLDGKDILSLRRLQTLSISEYMKNTVLDAMQQIFRESLQRGFSVQSEGDYDALRVIVALLTRENMPTFQEVYQQLGLVEMSFVYSDPVYQCFDIYAEQGIIQTLRNVSLENTKRTYVMSLYVYGNIWKNQHEQVQSIVRNEVTEKGMKLVNGRFDLDHDNNLIDTAKIVLLLTEIEHEMLSAKSDYFE